MQHVKTRKLDDYRWLIPREGAMRVDGMVFSNAELMKTLEKEESLRQVANVACLPGIVGRSLGMPDIHWGYGFAIGGVAAFDAEEGIVSPGGVGYDINCGCRLMTTRLSAAELRPVLKDLAAALFRDIPCGVGSTGSIRLTQKELEAVASQGARWAVSQGLGEPEDLDTTEDGGTFPGADPSVLSERVFKRGAKQLGTLGAGNHFLEIQAVDTVFDAAAAQAYGLFEGQATLFIHTGSRGFGHQICDDFLKEMNRKAPPDLPDRQLVYAGLNDALGRRYLSAMACAANYAWANRQILMQWARESLMRFLEIGPRDLGGRLLYDVCHNIAKMETHTIDGRGRRVCIHRKGATRALPPGHPLVPECYRTVGQPVLIPGDMGRASFVLAGAPGAMEHSFGSSCHGAGRLLSRSQAVKRAKGRAIYRELEDQGIYVRSRGKKTMAEEMPEAYKDVSQVVEVVHGAGLARKVARLRPLAVIKG